MTSKRKTAAPLAQHPLPENATAPCRPEQAATPWRSGGNYAHKSVLMDAFGRSIASGGNNRSIQGKQLEDALERAALCVNAHDTLVAALRLALPALDMHTSYGARSWPANTPKDGNGDVSIQAIADMVRAALENVTRMAKVAP
jgi:hypothetical protein